MFRSLVISTAIVLAGCTAAAQSPAAPSSAEHYDPTSDDWRPTYRSDPRLNEINRRIAICNGDPLDFYDNRDYCMRIGDWKDFDAVP